jgi:hypothetical protein
MKWVSCSKMEKKMKNEKNEQYEEELVRYALWGEIGSDDSNIDSDKSKKIDPGCPISKKRF